MPEKSKKIYFCIFLSLTVFFLHGSIGKAQRSFSQIPQFVFRNNEIDPEKPMVALTFDDGPGEGTERILDTLEKYGARATFFVMGENAENMKDVLKRQYEAGCEIGNHSYSHLSTEKLKKSRISAEFAKTDKIIKEITGSEAALVRPPFGRGDKKTSAAVNRPVILWSLDTLDWEVQDADKICRTVFSSVHDGDIILMHDIFPSTAYACERLIPGLINRGFQLVTVGELMECRGIELLPGEVYNDGKG